MESQLLFAQQGPFPKGGPQLPPGFDPTILIIASIVGGLVGFAIWLTVMAFFCRSMSKALNQCAERNRLMQPGLVWLAMIPCVHFVWGFFVAIQVPGSLQQEFQDRGDDDRSDYGKTLGIVAMITHVVGWLLGFIPLVGGCVGGVLGITALVCFIMFWVKIAGYSGRLASGGGRRRRGRDDDAEEPEEEEERPRRRRRRDVADEDED